jgi:hypothetical protein
MKSAARASLVLLAVLFAAAGCHREAPAPAYPVPEDLPIEETDLYQYLEEPEAPVDDDWREEDEGWNDPPIDEAPGDEADGEGEDGLDDGLAPEPAPIAP